MMNRQMQRMMQKAMGNQQIMNSNLGQQFMGILQSGDVAAGEALANEILKKQGLSREQGIQQAQNGLNRMFPGM